MIVKLNLIRRLNKQNGVLAGLFKTAAFCGFDDMTSTEILNLHQPMFKMRQVMAKTCLETYSLLISYSKS